MIDLRTHDWTADPIFDSAIVSHGFTPYQRDYDVVADVPAARPDGTGSAIAARYRYRFTHCVEATVATRIAPATWRASWGDEFTDLATWRQAGEPSGYVWGTEWADAYPGVEYRGESPGWSVSLGRTMHALRIETNVYAIDLVCHAVTVARLEPPA